jgi:hypothetical protein
MSFRVWFLIMICTFAPPLLAQPITPAPRPAARDTLTLALSTDTIASGHVDAVVRAHHREIKFCFEESGLKADPELAGFFSMILTIDTLGSVAQVDPSHREWSGTDGIAVEACVMQRARTWKFPASLAPAASRHEVTFHFAR